MITSLITETPTDGWLVDMNKEPFLSVVKASARILSAVDGLNRCENVLLAEAHGRTLAADLEHFHDWRR